MRRLFAVQRVLDAAVMRLDDVGQNSAWRRRRTSWRGSRLHALPALLETQADGGPAFGQRRRTVRLDLEVQASCRKWHQIILRCRTNSTPHCPPSASNLWRHRVASAETGILAIICC